MDNHKHPRAGAAGSGEGRRTRIVRLQDNLGEHTRHHSPAVICPYYVFDPYQPSARSCNPIQNTSHQETDHGQE